MTQADIIVKSGRRGWYFVILAMLGYLFSFIDRQILSLLIEPIQADLKISDTQFGLLQGLAFALFYSTVGIPLAGLTDRVSRPLVIAVGIAVWSAATMAGGIARGFLDLFISRVFVGAGEAALSPAAYSLISDLFPRDKMGRALSVYSAGSFFGVGIAFLAGGTIMSLLEGDGNVALWGWMLRPWQVALMGVGAPGLLLALVIVLTVKDPRVARGSTSDEVPNPSFRDVLSFLYQHRALFAPHFIGYTCAAAALYAVLGWAPAFTMRQLGLDIATTGLCLAPIAVFAGGGGVATSGWIMDRMQRAGRADAAFVAGRVGAAGAVLSAAALPFSTGLASGLALLAIVFFFVSFPMPPSSATLQMSAPANMRARISALFLFCNSICGVTLGSMTVGLLNDTIFSGPFETGHSLAVVVIVASLLASWFLAAGGRACQASDRSNLIIYKGVN